VAVGAISQAAGADLVNALSQNVGQGQPVQSAVAMAALKSAIDSQNQSILELVNAAVAPAAPGGKLNVFA
jgi:hypothetical protein